MVEGRREKSPLKPPFLHRIHIKNGENKHF